MPYAVLVVPGSIATLTGGYEYDRRIVDGLRALGWTIDIRELDASFPHPTTAALQHARAVLADIPDQTTVVIDSLAFGAIPGEVERETGRLRIIPLIHSLLASEIGLDRAIAARLEGSERRALAAVRQIVVVGKSLIGPLATYGIDVSRVAIVEPGIPAAPIARGSGDPDVVHMVTVATLNPGKGHDVLFRALASLPARNWRLTCAGSKTRHPETTTRLRAILQAAGLDDRVALTGELDAAAIAGLYDSADVAVLPTLGETYSLAAAEALARGLPVIGTATGAIPDLVGSDAGLVVPPGDAAALAEALSITLRDPARRERFAMGARSVRRRLPTWQGAAARMAAVLEHPA